MPEPSDVLRPDAEGAPAGPLPLVIHEAVVRVCGESLYWRSTLLGLLRRAGMHQKAVDRYDTSGL